MAGLLQAEITAGTVAAMKKARSKSRLYETNPTAAVEATEQLKNQTQKIGVDQALV